MRLAVCQPGGTVPAEWGLGAEARLTDPAVKECSRTWRLWPSLQTCNLLFNCSKYGAWALLCWPAVWGSDVTQPISAEIESAVVLRVHQPARVEHLLTAAVLLYPQPATPEALPAQEQNGGGD